MIQTLEKRRTYIGINLADEHTQYYKTENWRTISNLKRYELEKNVGNYEDKHKS